jgi:hypothetical protein
MVELQSRPTEERRRDLELRATVDYITELESSGATDAWECIESEYQLTQKILHESKDISVSDTLLKTYDTNYRVLAGIYAAGASHNGGHTLAAPLKNYFNRLIEYADRLFHRSKTDSVTQNPQEIQTKVREFLRQYVIHLLNDHRVVLLLLTAIIHRRLLDRNTAEFQTEAERLLVHFRELELRPDTVLTLLIYNLCQSSVNALNATDHATGSHYCEKAVELFKLLPEDSKVKGAIRGQIEEALRITTERLVQRIQEMPDQDQILIIENVIRGLRNIDLIAYLLPQMVFFLIRAQKYEDCLHHLERILTAQDLSRKFMNYQTAVTIAHEWCDSLLKAERYSRGQVTFSFIQQQKDNIQRVYDLAVSIRIPEMEDETFYNYELERLAVTFSHLGTLFFVTGNVEKAAAAYDRSFHTISMKKVPRNRDSIDEIMDRYKDTIHHPLNSAPIEAHSLIGIAATEKGYDCLMDAQIQKMEKDGTPVDRTEQSFATLDHPQKEMIADLLDAVGNKLKVRFNPTYSAYRPFIETRYHGVRKKMRV